MWDIQTALAVSGEKVTQVLGSQFTQGLEDHCLDSLATRCSMVFQPSWPISGALGVSKLLLVIILAARF